MMWVGKRGVEFVWPVIRPELGKGFPAAQLLRFVLRGDHNPVSKMVRGNGFLGGLGERFGLAQIQTRKVELFEANHDLGHQKFATYALNHLLEVVAPRLRVDDMQSRGRKPLSVAL